VIDVMDKFPFTRVLQFNFEDEPGVYVHAVKGSDVVELAARIHANTVVIFARDAWGRAFYDSKVSEKHPKLGSRDFLKEVVEAAKKKGIRVVAMVGHTTNPKLYEKHPEWAQRGIDGSPIAMDTDPKLAKGERMRWPLMCLNSPFLKHVAEEIREVLAYGVDGVFLDSFRYMPDLERACFCEYCKARYTKEKGRELPSKEDWESAEYREAFEWRYGVNVNALRELYKVVKSTKPSAILAYNNHPAGWKGRANTIVEKAKEQLDVVFAECAEADYNPPGFIAEMVKLTRAVSGGKHVWASRNSFHAALTTTTTTPVAIRQGLREAFIAGGHPFYLVFSTTFCQNPDVEQAAAEVFKELEKLEEYMEDAEPVKYVGVAYSNRSRDWGGKRRPDHITDSFRGFYYALTWAGVPVTFISDSELDVGAFKDYKAIVLANVQSMSEAASKHIEGFVEEGGGLVATYTVSLLDERGVERKKPALSKLLGIEYDGLLKYPWSYLRLTKKHAVTDGFAGGQLLLWGDFDREFMERRVPEELAWHVRVMAADGEVLGRVVEPIGEYGNEYENGRSPPPAGSEREAPAILAKEPGGRIAYFTGQLGRLYWRLGLPGHERLILNSVRWVAGESPARVTGPGLLQFEAYERDGQLIIYLLNLTYSRRIVTRPNSALSRIWHSTADCLHPPHEVVSLNDVSIMISGEYEVLRAYSPLTGKRYHLEDRDSSHVIKLDTLGEFEAVVIDVK